MIKMNKNEEYVYILHVRDRYMRIQTHLRKCLPEPGSKMWAIRWDKSRKTQGEIEGLRNGVGSVAALMYYLQHEKSSELKWMILKAKRSDIVKKEGHEVFKVRRAEIVEIGKKHEILDKLSEMFPNDNIVFKRIIAGDREKLVLSEGSSLIAGVDSKVYVHNNTTIISGSGSHIKTYARDKDKGLNSKMIVGAKSNVKLPESSLIQILSDESCHIDVGSYGVVFTKADSNARVGINGVIQGDENTTYTGGMGAIFICKYTDDDNNVSVVTDRVDDKRIISECCYKFNIVTKTFEKCLKSRRTKK
jgi:hypothetical protein